MYSIPSLRFSRTPCSVIALSIFGSSNKSFLLIFSLLNLLSWFGPLKFFSKIFFTGSTKLGSATGLEATTGLARQTFAAATETKILEADDYTDNKAAKLYIKNTDTSGTDTVRLHLGTVGGSSTIGWLDPDDWALIPWSAASDINVTCTSATTIVEWMLFYE